MTAQSFREAMARFASGVTVVAARRDEEVRAMTVSAFASLSLSPPLVLVCLDEKSKLLPVLLASGRFSINLLGEDQHALSDHFAGRRQMSQVTLSGDPPRLPESLATLVCRLWQNYPGGDHALVVGEVQEVELGSVRAPLVYWHRQYRRLSWAS